MTLEKTCRLFVNGEEQLWDGGALPALLRASGLDPAAPGIAVALNGAVVPRRAWPHTLLAEGDRLELVGMFKGG
jgi:sulfur carrier protein